MNSETFEEVAVSTKIVGETSSWIEEGSAVILVFFKGKVFEVNVPNICIFQIVTTDPIVKGSTKPAVLSCGATITVPGYLEQGEMVKVDTEKKEFLERVKQEK
jgi:elongation factor P